MNLAVLASPQDAPRRQRRRRDIFVETQINNNQAPLGATYSTHPPADAAPTVLSWNPVGANQLVYELNELTPEEIALVENR